MLIEDQYTLDCLKSYFPTEDQVRLVAPYELDKQQLIALSLQVSESDAEGIANCLKMGVEHSADSNTKLAFDLTETIIAIGTARENGSLVGLGTMAQGDILAHSGQNLEAWNRLGAAGEIYLKVNDELGWARTRIGRLWIGPELDQSHVEQAFSDAQQAEQIFLKTPRYDRLQRLYHNWAVAYGLMGRHEEAVSYYQRAIETVERQTNLPNSNIMIAYLYCDMGLAYNDLGQLSGAMQYLNQARDILLGAQQYFTSAMAGYGIAVNHMIRGEYRQALHLLLNSVLPNLAGNRTDAVKLTLIDCYLALNRNQEAYELAKEIVDSFENDPDRNHQIALSALRLATAQTRLGYLADAQQSLELAETKFRPYENMVLLIQVRRGQIALRQGDFATARSIGHATAKQFLANGQPMNWIEATLLEAEAKMEADDLEGAQYLALQALRYAREQQLSPACYRCYVMLGQISEKRGRRHTSIRLYQSALVILRNIQRSLTISLRLGFLEDKLLPFRRLMHLYLTGGQVESAFHTLELLKSQVSIDYLSQGELLRWVENERTRPLLEALRGLRDKYRWLTQMESTLPVEDTEHTSKHHNVTSYSSLRQNIADCERQIRQITEQLYLFAEIEPLG